MSTIFDDGKPPLDDERGKEKTSSNNGLFVTDAELIRCLGVPKKIARQAITMLDRDRASSFPNKQALWGNWPAVRAWLDYTCISKRF
jgi:hypothetical protein